MSQSTVTTGRDTLNFGLLLEATSSALLDSMYEWTIEYLLRTGARMDDLRAARAAHVSRGHELHEMLIESVKSSTTQGNRRPPGVVTGREVA